MFAADLFFMTREGAILGRPASLVRAGEEVHAAQKLLDLKIPILASVNGSGTFEGADAAWLDAKTVLIGIGKRTNEHGVRQVTDTLAWLGVEAVPLRLPPWAMHLMGVLRFASPGIAVAWPGGLPEGASVVLNRSGYRLEYIPDEAEAVGGHALNFVTLGPLRILAPAGNPRTIAFYRDLDIDCIEVEVSELIKAAGAIGCLTGILERSAD
jgi:N-dimethylarginine dimethylaminohydrolase